MEGAKVVIFEDDEDWQEIIGEIIEGAGHEVIARATTMDGARAVIDGFADDAVDVAVVDGNLTRHNTSGRDGAEVAERLRAKIGEKLVIIGCSGTNTVDGADHTVSKAKNSEDIAQIIADL
jgi:CheY-like chemotaxis protein